MMLLVAPLLLAASAASPPARIELPIKVNMVKGPRRYSVTITVNGQSIEAAFDTGSVGLRLLTSAAPLPGTGDPVRIGFNSGVELTGPALKAQVGYGALPAVAVRVHRIDRASCRPEVPQCDAAGGNIAAFRIMSDGVPGQGFVAILGIGLRDDALGHPFVQAGITRWIVELPRVAGEAGRLVLNPTDAEVARYRQVRFLPGRNEIPGCLISATTKVCAPAMVDSGAAGIQLFGGGEADLLPQGTEAQLQLGEDAAVTMPVTIGRRDQGAMMRVRPARPDAKQSLSFGIAPYLRWSILYDAGNRTLGVADR